MEFYNNQATKKERKKESSYFNEREYYLTRSEFTWLILSVRIEFLFRSSDKKVGGNLEGSGDSRIWKI